MLLESKSLVVVYSGINNHNSDRMSDLPFTLPGSLNSYLEQFPEQPDRSIERLRSFLKKRGQDAIGHMLLAWLLHINGNKSEALETATQARHFAPGSPLLENYLFFILHPDGFNAALPDLSAQQDNSTQTPTRITADLEKIIHKLTEKRGAAVKDPDESPMSEDEDLSKKTSYIQDLATETLASIYHKQGKLQDAIRVYGLLKSSMPGRADEFEQKINELRAQMEE